MKLCFLGIHKFSNWSDFTEKVIYDEWSAGMDDMPSGYELVQERTCVHCNILEIRTIVA